MALEITINDLQGFSIVTGAVLSDGYLLSSFTKDTRVSADIEDRHSYLVIKKDDRWARSESAYPIRSQAALREFEQAIISISDVGQVRHSSPSGAKDEEVVGSYSRKRVLGRTRLNEVRSIDGFAYCVGTRRSAYKRTAPNEWLCIDGSCYEPDNFNVGFESVDGFSHSEVYAVGKKGEIWLHDGDRWSKKESGTNAWLNKAICSTDGVVYVVGDKGTILKGRNDQWSLVEKVGENHEFWSIEEFNGRKFVTSDTLLMFELNDDGLELVDFGDCTPPTAPYHLTLSDKHLYCFGFKEILRFDGAVWEEVLKI